MLWLDTSTIWSRRSMKRGNKPAVKVSLLFTPIPGVDCLYQSSPPGNGHTRVLLRGTSRSGIRSSPASVPEGWLASPRRVWPCAPSAPFQSPTLLPFPPLPERTESGLFTMFSACWKTRGEILVFTPLSWSTARASWKWKKDTMQHACFAFFGSTPLVLYLLIFLLLLFIFFSFYKWCVIWFMEA